MLRSQVLGRDAEQAPLGHGWPVGAAWREQCRSEGTLSEAQGRMQGQTVLPTFALTKVGRRKGGTDSPNHTNSG